jgi:hypothetical protein
LFLLLHCLFCCLFLSFFSHARMSVAIAMTIILFHKSLMRRSSLLSSMAAQTQCPNIQTSKCSNDW